MKQTRKNGRGTGTWRPRQFWAYSIVVVAGIPSSHSVKGAHLHLYILQLTLDQIIYAYTTYVDYSVYSMFGNEIGVYFLLLCYKAHTDKIGSQQDK